MKTTEDVYKEYGPRILKIMESISTTIKEETSYNVSEISFMPYDEYRWNIVVDTDGDIENAIDISFIIFDSEYSDGSENGVNFGIDIVWYGGEIVGGYTPYNYTDRCWVNIEDSEDVEDRFLLLENMDQSSIIPLLEKEFSKL
jgi:hypothetical protein